MSKTIFLSWSLMVALIWLQLVSGTNSNIPAYSSQLKRLLSLSQVQLNNIVFASDAGKVLCILSGVAAKRLPLWLVLVIGSILGLIGYGLQYLAITFHIPFLLSFSSIFALTFIAGNSICWINTVCYVAIIDNFPSHRQVLVGIITSYQGLSAKMFTDIVHAVMSSAPGKTAQDYLLLNTILPMVVSIIAAGVLALKIDAGKSRSMRVEFF